MRILITGVRQNEDVTKLEYLIRQLPLEITTVVTSDRTGVDAWARRWAKKNGIELLVLPTMWERYKQHACRIRNIAMMQSVEACAIFTRRDCSYSVTMAQCAMNCSKPLFTRPLD